LILAWLPALSGCAAAPGEGDETLRIVLSGRGGQARSFYDDVIPGLSYKLELSGPGGETLSHRAGAGTESVSFPVSPGEWIVRVEAYTGGGLLYGTGETETLVVLGKTNTVSVGMEFSPAWHVSQEGDDKTGTGSEEAPFDTIDKALEAIKKAYETDWPDKEGDTPLPRAQILVSGTITLGTGEERGMVVIDGSGPDGVYPPIVLRGKTAQDDENRIDAGKTRRVLFVQNANLTLGPGLTLTGGKSGDQIGGGVLVAAGSFTMEGGTISGNETSDYKTNGYGGGVFVEAGTFTMAGGTISGNTASGNDITSGGGVYLLRGTFNMTGGTIRGNKAKGGSGGGGGVYAVGDGTFTKTGGVIYGSNAEEDLKNFAASGKGHAAAAALSTDVLNERDATAGPEINLDSAKSGAEGGWE
jgi:hypothetical protein